MKLSLQALLAPLAVALAPSAAPAQVPCGPWSVVEVPVDSGWNHARFEDVSVLPDGTVWAVGYAQLPSPPFGPENVTLAMRYQDGQWTHTPTPYVAPFAGGANDYLHAVAALAPDDVWAAGERHGDAGGLSVGAWLHVLHWDGSSWSEVPVPAPPGGAGINFSGTRVYDVQAFAPDDIWFAGLWGEPNALFSVTWRPLAMHWDGSSLTVHDTPAVSSGSSYMQMTDISGVAPDDVWGICTTISASGVSLNPTILHYDGTSWSQVAAPSLGQSVVMDEVVALAADDVWVTGHFYFPAVPFALHWDGASFSVVNGLPFLNAAAALSPTEVYFGGAEVQLFDGAQVAQVSDFGGAVGNLLGLDALPGSCTVWGAGTRPRPGGGFEPVAAVMTLDTLLGSTYCHGGEVGLACPCGNEGGAGEGCVNSTGAGARLLASGSASLAAQDLVLRGYGLAPGQPGMYFQGTHAVNGGAGALFGDGLRCAGGGVARLQVVAADAHGQSATSVDLGAAGGVAAGDLRRYQLWYRDPSGSPCGAGFNLTAALALTWQP